MFEHGLDACGGDGGKIRTVAFECNSRQRTDHEVGVGGVQGAPRGGPIPAQFGPDHRQDRSRRRSSARLSSLARCQPASDSVASPTSTPERIVSTKATTCQKKRVLVAPRRSGLLHAEPKGVTGQVE